MKAASVSAEWACMPCTGIVRANIVIMVLNLTTREIFEIVYKMYRVKPAAVSGPSMLCL
jgi:hypothetical protein